MRRVHLSKNSLCSSAIKNLFSSFKGTNVIELSLDNNNISYADLKELSQQVDGTCLIRVKTSEPCYQLQEALKKNLQKLNLAHYYATDLHNLHGLTPEEKAKHQGVGIATPQNELSYAGGILMDEALPARAREIIQGYLPLMRGHLGHGLKKEKKQDQTSEEKEAESRTGCAIM